MSDFSRGTNYVRARPSSNSGIFSLAGCTIQAGACTFHLAPLVILGDAPYLSVFKTEQLQALAYMFFKLYVQTYRIALVFFGFFCLLIGYLIFKSDFLPRILGVLMALAGLGWLTFLSPPFGAKYFPYLFGCRSHRRRRVGPVAPRGRHERTTMEGASQRTSGAF